MRKPDETKTALTRIDTICPFDVSGVFWAEVLLNEDWEQKPSSGVVMFDAGGESFFSIDFPSSLSGAVEKRRREYLAGRLCAAHVLRRLGAPELLQCTARVPKWPSGVAGSISHNELRAIAVATRQYSRIGVDCETLLAAQGACEIADLVLTEEERAICPSFLAFETFVVVAFSAKESIYKAVSADVGRVLDFRELTVTHCTSVAMHVRFEGAQFLAHWRLNEGECQTLVAFCRIAHN